MLELNQSRISKIALIVLLLKVTMVKSGSAQQIQCIVKEVMNRSDQCYSNKKKQIKGFKFYIDTLGDLKRMDVYIFNDMKLRQKQQVYIYDLFAQFNYSDNLPKSIPEYDLIHEQDSTYTYPISIKYSPNQQWDCK